MEEIQEFHTGLASELSDAIGTSMGHYRPRFAEALQGAAGDALLRAHDANIKLWGKHQDMHEAAAKAASQALLHVKGLQGRIDSLAEAGEEEFNKAVHNRDPITAMEVWTRYNGHAEESTAEATEKATGAIRAANFTIPLDKIPEDSPRKEDKKEGKKEPGDGKQTDPTMPGADGGNGITATPDGSQTTTAPAGPNAAPAASTTPDGTQTASPAGPLPGGPNQTPVGPPLSQVPQSLSGVMGRAASGGGGSSAGGSGSALSGLGSGLNPGSMGSGLGSGMPTSPASSLPSVPAAQSAASPMANAGSSFQSGLASGMGATAPPPVAAQPIAQQAVTAQQPLMGSPAAGSGPAGVPIAPHGVPDGGSGGGPVQGGYGGGAPPAGGAPMMPPAAMTGGPLAPYSAPGAGAPPAGGAPTAPAAGGQSSSGGAAPAGGSGLASPGPVLAGGSGSGASMGGLGAAASEVNPDLLLAQRVLAGLVRGSQHYPTLVWWAVAVLRMPVGAQVVIASNIGDGGYLPAGVFIPSTARLAVVDPAVPFGWGQRWMGNRHPAKALVDHFEHVGKRVAGMEMSAMVTNESWADTPACVNDFLVVNHVDALNMLSEAPKLDGGHQHRLAALDPALAHRVSALERRGYAPDWVAGQLTVAVIAAAQQQPDIGDCKLVTDDEVEVLQAVHRGSADEKTWQLYDERADQRHDRALVVPETHGIDDVDGSEVNQKMAAVYERYYRAGRIVELVRWWKYRPPPLAEVVYCCVEAGFASVVAAVVSTLEMRAAQQPGGAA
ncbi:hypothetical protein [Mycobacterium intracellulare]|uniref:hypothetical protein n=1 Tax=Mycobacterium intracellulare TaxID=1767 RepID=UPI001140F2C7|nr:hypothetical protein [Mycobacterium intracellulare]